MKKNIKRINKPRSFEKLLTTDDISKLLCVKPATLRYWVHVNAIRFHKVGSLTRFIGPEILEDFWEGKIGKIGVFRDINNR